MKKIITYNKTNISFVAILLIVIGVSTGSCTPGGDVDNSREPGPDGNFTILAQIMVHDGLPRHYKLAIPSGRPAGEPVPLVIMLHGANGNSDTFLDNPEVELEKKAAALGYMSVFPEGTGDVNLRKFSWNAVHCCAYAWENNIDDVGFIRALIETLIDERNVDPARVYVTGFSNGAMMTYRIAAELSHMVTAIAPVSGTIGGQPTLGSPQSVILPPANPVPVMTIHGQKDQVVSYYGGQPFDGSPRTDLSVMDSISFWLTHNRCLRRPENYFSLRFRYSKETYLPLPNQNGAQVILYSLFNHGHYWPRDIGADNTTDLILEFFAGYTGQ